MAKDKIIDITKTGPLNFRELQQLNAQEEEQYLPENSLGLFAANYGKLKEFNTLLGDWGESMFDEDVANQIELENLQDIRAENLPGILKLGAGFGKMISTAGTTFLDGTLGTVWGLGQGIANAIDDDDNTTFLLGLWDNDFNKAMASVNEYMEEIMPNYYSKEEQESPWYTQMGTMNFWADGFLKNAGFMLGAAGAAMATGGLNAAIGNSLKATKLGSALAGVGKFADWTAKTLTSANGEAAIEAINSVNEKSKELDFNLKQRRDLKYNEINLESLSLAQLAQQEVLKEISMGRNPELAYLDYLKKLDYIKNSENTKKLLIDTDIERTKQESESMLRDAGNSIYAMNMALLATTNNINMSSIIRGGYNNAELLNNTLFKIGEKPVLKGTEEFSKGILEGTIKAEAEEIKHGTAKTLGRWGLNALSEGFQEGSQSIISEGSGLQMQAKLNKFARENTLLGAELNPEVSEELVDTTKAMYEAYSQQFGTIESPGWKEAFLGALTGGTGMVSVKKTDEGYRPTWVGGWKEAHDDVYEDRDKLLKMLDIVNTHLQDPKTGLNIRHTISKMALKKEADDALLNGDIQEYKNNEIAALVSDALFYKNLGMLDDYMAIYDNYAKGLNDKDLEELYTLTYNKEEKKSPLTEERKEDIRNKYQEKAQSTKKKILNILDNLDIMNKLYGSKFSDENRDIIIQELTFRQSLLDDTYRRIEELEKERDSIKGDSEAKVLQRFDTSSAIYQLEKLAKSLKASIEKANSNPLSLEKEVNKIKEDSEKYKLGMDTNKVLEQYSKAKTLREVNDIYKYSDSTSREKVLNNAIKNAPKETKKLLKLFKDFLEDIQVLDKAIQESFKYYGKYAPYYMLERYKEINRVINEITEDDNSDFRASLIDKIEDLQLYYANLEQNSSDPMSQLKYRDIAEDYLFYLDSLNDVNRFKSAGLPKESTLEEEVSEDFEVESADGLESAWEEEESKSTTKKTEPLPLPQPLPKPLPLKIEEEIKTNDVSSEESLHEFKGLNIQSASVDLFKKKALEGNPIGNKELKEKYEQLRKLYNNTLDSETLRDLISLAKDMVLPDKYYNELIQWIKDELKVEKAQNREGVLVKWYNDTFNKATSKELKEIPKEEHKDGEIVRTTSTKDGITTTKYTKYRKTKSGEVKPVIGSRGPVIDSKYIDINSFEQKDKFVKFELVELREKDGKFVGEVLAKDKEGIWTEFEVKFTENPDKKTTSEVEQKEPFDYTWDTIEKIQVDSFTVRPNGEISLIANEGNIDGINEIALEGSKKIVNILFPEINDKSFIESLKEGSKEISVEGISKNNRVAHGKYIFTLDEDGFIHVKHQGPSLSARSISKEDLEKNNISAEEILGNRNEWSTLEDIRKAEKDQKRRDELDNFDNNFYITITSTGLRAINSMKDWSKAAKDMRHMNTGWYEENGLTYYIEQSKTGRVGDNITIWFKNPPTEQQKKNVEEWLANSSKIDKLEFLDAFNKITSKKYIIEKPIKMTPQEYHDKVNTAVVVENNTQEDIDKYIKKDSELVLKVLNGEISKRDMLESLGYLIENLNDERIEHYANPIIDAYKPYITEAKEENKQSASSQELQSNVSTVATIDYEAEQEKIEQTNDSFRGNAFLKYSITELLNNRKLVKIDLDYYHQWLNKRGYKIQEFIDNELNKIPKDIPVKYIHERGVYKSVLLGMKYDSIKDYINPNNATIINTNEGKYVLIGTLGYPSNLKESLGKQFEFINSLLILESTSYGNEYYVGPFENRIKDMNDGSLAISEESKDLNALLSNPLTNPKNLVTDDLQWVVVEGTLEEITFKPINVKSDNSLHFNINNPMPGLVYLYIPTAKGNYIPSYINPLSWNDGIYSDSLYSKDLSKWEIQLIDPKGNSESKKIAISELRKALIFPLSGNIFYNEDLNNIVLKDATETYEIINFNKEDYSIYDGELALFNALLKLNPRFNILTRVLSSNPLYYIDAGLIETNLVSLGTFNSLVYLYPINSRGQYVVNKRPEISTTFSNRERLLEVYLNGSLYKFNGANFYDSKGNLILNELELQSLRDTVGIINNLFPKFELNKTNYWEVAADRIYTKDRGNSYRLLTPQLIEEYSKKKVKKLTENQLKEEVKQALQSSPKVVKSQELEEEDSFSTEEKEEPTTSIETNLKSFINGEQSSNLMTKKDLDILNNSINFDTLISNQNNEDAIADVLEEKGITVDTIQQIKDGIKSLGLDITVNSQEAFNNLVDNIRSCKN